MSFHERLKQLRLSRNLTQRDIAEALQISTVRYSQYERGVRTPDFDLIQKIAQFFGVTIDFLFSDYAEENAEKHQKDTNDVAAKKLGEIIRSILKEKRWTIEDLAQKTGLPSKTLKDYELGFRSPDIDDLIKIADAFDVTIDYLVGRTKDVIDFFTTVHAMRVLGESQPLKVSILRTLSLNKIIQEEDERRLLDFVQGNEYLPENFNELNTNLLGYIVDDDSMILFGIPSGAKIIFKTTHEAEDGDLVVVQIEDRILIRKIRFISRGWTILIPGNPRFKEEIFPSQRLRVIGKVVRVITDFI